MSGYYYLNVTLHLLAALLWLGGMFFLAAVAVMPVVQAAHDFILGPRASRLAAGSPPALRARSGAAWLARSNAVVGLVLVLAALRLARGG